MTSHPKSPRATGNEAEPAVQEVSSLRGRRNKGRGRGGEGRKGKGMGSYRPSFESHFKYLALSARCNKNRARAAFNLNILLETFPVAPHFIN